MNDSKLAKSTGNTAYLSDVVARGIHPFALRYWFLTAHYRQSSNFTWEALEAAQKAYIRLYQKYQEVKDVSEETIPSRIKSRFVERLNDDLDSPGAIAVLWESLNADAFSAGELKTMLNLVDSTLGFGFAHEDELLKRLAGKPQQMSAESLPDDIRQLFNEREEARAKKDWARADQLRDEIAAMGYTIEDSTSGPRLLKK